MRTSQGLARTDADQLAALRDLVAAFASRRPVRTVAVVGNAPQRPNAARAAGIDSADLVIRCNAFALDRADQSPSVGRRADVVVFNRDATTSAAFFHRYRERAYLVVDHEPDVERDSAVRSWPPDLGYLLVPRRSIVSELAGLLHGRGHLAAPTTGLIAAYLARRLFSDADVVLTGFSAGPESDLLRSWVSSGQTRLIT